MPSPASFTCATILSSLALVPFPVSQLGARYRLNDISIFAYMLILYNQEDAGCTRALLTAAMTFEHSGTMNRKAFGFEGDLEKNGTYVFKHSQRMDGTEVADPASHGRPSRGMSITLGIELSSTIQNPGGRS